MNRIFKSILLLSSITLASCSNVGGSINESDSLSPLAKSLEKIKKSFTFEGNLIQTRQFYTDETFSEVDNSGYEESDLRSESNLTFYFTEDGFRRAVTIKDTNTNQEVPYLDETYFADENDYAYEEYLSYENKIGRDYLTDSYNYVSMHGASFNNPFEYIYESDFTLNDDGTYSLKLSKASEMFFKLCYFFATGAENAGGNAIATVNANGELTSLSYTPVTRYVIESDTYTQQTMYYSIEQTFTFYIIDAGTTELEHITLEDAKDNTNLKSAFNKFNVNNATISVTNIEESSSGDIYKYQKIYLDGSNVYVKYYEDSSSGVGSDDALDPKYDYLLTENKNLPGRYEARGYNSEEKVWLPSNSTRFGNINQDTYTYSDFVPTLKNLSSDLFTYDSATNEYICENDAAKDIAINSFLPNATELQTAQAKNANKIVIQLNTDNTIKLVTIYYSYLDFFSETLTTEGRIVIRYQNIGNTTIPFDALNNLGE